MANELPEKVSSLVGQPVYKRQADIVVDSNSIRAFCAATGNANPRHWSGNTAPASMLSTWCRPEQWQPDADTPLKPLQLHYDLKDLLQYPTAIVVNIESVFNAPVCAGDQLLSQQVLESISEEKDTRLGRGRFWNIAVQYFNQHDTLVGTDIFSCLGYRKAS